MEAKSIAISQGRYYNNPKDLMERLELLGGSILAGNDGVKQEFSQIAHALNKLGVITNGQLNDLVKVCNFLV